MYGMCGYHTQWLEPHVLCSSKPPELVLMFWMRKPQVCSPAGDRHPNLSAKHQLLGLSPFWVAATETAVAADASVDIFKCLLVVILPYKWDVFLEKLSQVCLFFWQSEVCMAQVVHQTYETLQVLFVLRSRHHVNVLDFVRVKYGILLTIN